MNNCNCKTQKDEKSYLCCFADPTIRQWNKNNMNCQVVRCRNKDAFLSSPPTWAVHSVRKATIGDEYDPLRPAEEQVIPNAGYVCVRSCFCNRRNCPHFKPEAYPGQTGT